MPYVINEKKIYFKNEDFQIKHKVAEISLENCL